MNGSGAFFLPLCNNCWHGERSGATEVWTIYPQLKATIVVGNNVIGIKEHLLFKEGTTAHEEPRVPVMYMPRPFCIPVWEVGVVGNGRYTMELDGFKAVGDTSSGLVFADKKGAEIWAIKPQQKDKEFPFELYTIESVNEPGIGWFVVDNPDVNTQVDTAHYATTALWFFIPDDARAPISF